MDRELLVRQLVDSFDSRSDLHKAYKGKVKRMMMDCIQEFLNEYIEKDNFSTYEDLEKWVENFVETRFKPKD